MSNTKKVDDKEMMADVASVILLLAVSEERLQQIIEAKEDSVFRQITTYCFKKWPDKHSSMKKDTTKTYWQYKWNSLLHRTRTI